MDFSRDLLAVKTVQKQQFVPCENRAKQQIEGDTFYWYVSSWKIPPFSRVFVSRLTLIFTKPVVPYQLQGVVFFIIKVKVKVSPILVGPPCYRTELIPYMAVCLQVTACIVMNPVVGCHHLTPGPQWHTCIVINLAVGCHYFPPSQQLPSQPSGVTAPRPVPTYTTWWQRHIRVRKLPRVWYQNRWPWMTLNGIHCIISLNLVNLCSNT